MAKHFGVTPEPPYDPFDPVDETMPHEPTPAPVVAEQMPFEVAPAPFMDEVEPLEVITAPEPQPGMPAWLDFLVTAVITIAVVLFVRAFVADTYEVPTGSMLETIQLGDRLVGEKISYRFREPRAGEVVTFEDPTDPNITLIKRIIATEGQTVDLIGGAVYVDGVELDEPYVLGKASEPIARHASTLDEDISYPFVVPEGCVWVMGDNRTNSLDSRYFGAVSTDALTARALFIFWPPSDVGTL